MNGYVVPSVMRCMARKRGQRMGHGVEKEMTRGHGVTSEIKHDRFRGGESPICSKKSLTLQFQEDEMEMEVGFVGGIMATLSICPTCGLLLPPYDTILTQVWDGGKYDVFHLG